jgi:hypothetical protein
MPFDLRAVLRDALDVSVPPAPTDSIRKRAREISRGRVARSVSGAVAIAVCSLCVWLGVTSDAWRNGGGLPGANLPTPIASAAPARILTPAPRPAPGPALT